MAQVACKSCDICDGGPGRHFCQQCDQLFCENCKTSHLRTKISKNHIFSSGLNINQEKKTFCSDHNESFIFRCIDCDTAVCQICAVKKHNRHNMLGIGESLNVKEETKQKISSETNSEFSDSLDRVNKNNQEIVNTANIVDVEELPNLTQCQERMRNMKINEVPNVQAVENSKKGTSEKKIWNLFSVSEPLTSYPGNGRHSKMACKPSTLRARQTPNE
ncbi:Hypothetical predicted protein [Mytilus galloprovincialis]|uniref:B box-type domain-containing protein n=1 Tax=Mytilus galloprovincialis TaxID=29158 RepID=A0A8B6EY16_MYTGA|nr:Hypothetical predicted protein [Mytilus galloprovincialis]